ncbi:MAG: hypothetical protein WCX63_04670 [Methanoregula sp.]
MKQENLQCVGCPVLLLPGIRLSPKFFGISDFYPKNYGRTNFRPELFCFFLDFEPEKIQPEKFHANFFCDFLTFTQKFSDPENFAAKKGRIFRSYGPGHSG